ncbi:hypothetical protein IMG5_085330 [Ichthyophthirius multifiliis]|uniref:Uncharacterized protein n=1 Tax=Ichthyophthirius multifiliis TaxID=5932 RepID=G0QQX7_ICHMU|nr:hypothetical protein IMG5_085330 [Ichthyophthirius multifiliis]EGR32381.1 hypothetical protein IMG5_085330 [Ichthyophthirius multifiliis]|eukprot:XP_004035867.1 hypothetical protein IMG5_085330 [Ichthyophthirius multifiliis]
MQKKQKQINIINKKQLKDLGHYKKINFFQNQQTNMGLKNGVLQLFIQMKESENNAVKDGIIIQIQIQKKVNGANMKNGFYFYLINLWVVNGPKLRNIQKEEQTILQKIIGIVA